MSPLTNIFYCSPRPCGYVAQGLRRYGWVQSRRLRELLGWVAIGADYPRTPVVVN